MDTTIRNLDVQAYKELRARAVLEGRTVGEVLNEAIRGYLIRVAPESRKTSLRALTPEPFPIGNENLSSEIDSLLYGRPA
jgi:plasmid stability protein